MRLISRARWCSASYSPSGLASISNARATFEAFFGGGIDFTRTLRAGERYVGGWRSGPELIAGVLLQSVFAFAEIRLERTVLYFRGVGTGINGRHGA